MRNGGVSFWWAATGLPTPGPALDGPTTADVCIVGAGFTGLWTALLLARARPGLDIVVLESRFAGYGASGRNGGWLSGLVPGPRARYAATGGRDGVLALEAAMRTAVVEVADLCAEEGIDADLVRAGQLTVATTPAQRLRLKAHFEDEQGWGNTDLQWLEPAELAARVCVAGAAAGTWTPHCARLQPAKLAAGMRRAVLARGVRLCEQTPVTAIEPGVARTARGDVRAPHVLRATEGFTAALPGERRTWLPMNSSMVVTEPLTPAQWEQIGWAGNETLADGAHAYVYAQRTADGRIALGGRGVPYRFGSRTDNDGSTQEATVEALRAALVRLFPALHGVGLDHAWSGVLGVPRDWCATVGLDPATGLGWAGGYSGDGVTTSHLAGRTLTDLVLGHSTALTALPWVGRRPRKWEPEPLRWLGVRAIYTAYRAADRQEAGGRPGTAPIARLADALSGRT